MKNITRLITGFLPLLIMPLAQAHDTWVQTQAAGVAPGQVVHVDLMLGNHGNDHRDFRLWGRVRMEGATLDLIGPEGTVDLREQLIWLGSEQNAAFWTARLEPQTPGIYQVLHTSDRVVHYAPLRSVKSARTFFVVHNAEAGASRDAIGPQEPLGNGLELLPMGGFVLPVQPEEPVTLELRLHGKPLAGSRVTMVPRGEQLDAPWDPRYDQLTDEQGMVCFTPTTRNYHLFVAHARDSQAGGEGYSGTKYSATLVITIP